MATTEITSSDRLKRFLYTGSYHGYYITGASDPYYDKLNHVPLLQWVKTAPDTFIQIITAANNETLVVQRSHIFYLLAQALHCDDFAPELRNKIKNLVFALLRSDHDFFDFVKYYTLKRDPKTRVATSLRKMIVRFYQSKEPKQLMESVTGQGSHHSWTHKDLFKLCHFKCSNILCDPIVKYALFGVNKLPDTADPNTAEIVDYLKKSHELKTTEDVARAVNLMKELNVSVDRVNSKLNKNEQVWAAVLRNLDTRDLLQHLYSFYKWGFLKSGSQFQAGVCEALSSPDNVKRSGLHPIEVFIYLRVFEKGGKVVNGKLVEYLQTKNLKENVIKRLTTPAEPKCKQIIQNINKCLVLSYSNVQATGKKFMLTIDTTPTSEDKCFHNKRIGHFEAIHAIVRYLTKVERNVTIAVFKDDHITLVDLGKSHAAIERLQEHQAKYIIPSAPLDWARNKKKQVDVFVNFMNCTWAKLLPEDVKEKMEKLPDALHKYAKKMKTPETRVVKIFLGGACAAFGENSKNILSIGGFSTDVPRVLEAFSRGHFC